MKPVLILRPRGLRRRALCRPYLPAHTKYNWERVLGISLFHRMVISLSHPLSMLIQIGDQQDSPSSLMLETPSLGGTRRNIPLELNQATSSSHSPPTSSSERSVNIDSSTNSIIAQRASGLSIYLQGPREPLRDVKAARLLQHYIDHLASWVWFLKWQDRWLN
jgi:hypothetical protein